MKIIKHLLFLSFIGASLNAQVIPNGFGTGGMGPSGEFVPNIPETVKDVAGQIAEKTVNASCKVSENLTQKTEGFSEAAYSLGKNTIKGLTDLFLTYPAHTACLISSGWSVSEWYSYLTCKNNRVPVPWKSTLVALTFGYCAYAGKWSAAQ